jgi:hypothetical protein
MTETRVVSETGGAKGRKLARFDLIPTRSLWALAEVYGKGLEKYPTEPGRKDNWRNGYPFSDAYAAAQRHMNKFWSGEDIDPETGMPHLALAAFHLFSLLHWMGDEDLVERYDDRQDPEWDEEEYDPFADWEYVGYREQPVTPEPSFFVAPGYYEVKTYPGPEFGRIYG